MKKENIITEIKTIDQVVQDSKDVQVYNKEFSSNGHTLIVPNDENSYSGLRGKLVEEVLKQNIEINLPKSTKYLGFQDSLYVLPVLNLDSRFDFLEVAGLESRQINLNGVVSDSIGL